MLLAAVAATAVNAASSACTTAADAATQVRGTERWRLAHRRRHEGAVRVPYLRQEALNVTRATPRPMYRW